MAGNEKRFVVGESDQDEEMSAAPRSLLNLVRVAPVYGSGRDLPQVRSVGGSEAGVRRNLIN